jgi:hypothetical protein
MANDREVASVLAFLHELFPTREISAATLDAWALVFEDWTGEELLTCAKLAAKSTGRTFFPTPGEIAAYRVAQPVVDSAVMLRKIERLSVYHPASGMIAPRVESVRAAFGDDVADAYATAGGARCFADNETTRDIACREFQKALTEYVAHPTQRAILAKPEDLLRFANPRQRNGSGENLSDILKRLSPGAPA